MTSTFVPPPLLIMGVAGCGKSALGELLAESTGCRFFDGDDFHPPANVTKMRAGQPLTDADRADWLGSIAATLADASRREPCAVACSALKSRYRERLRAAVPELRVVFLDVPQAVATARVGARRGHYMPASLVVSQFAALEPPLGEAHTLALDACAPLAELADTVRRWWLGAATPEHAD
jgi:gluconokinase